MLPKKRRSAAHTLVVGLLAAASACTEPTTPTAIPAAPNAALVAAANPNNGKVKVKTFQLSANTLRIDGASVTAQVSIGNSGPPFQSGVSLRAEITQGTATRQAASLPTQCNPGDNPGFLPPNNCDMTFAASASNSATGTGTLVPGSATFVLHVIQTTSGVETEMANKSIVVNLVSTPSITTLTLASTTLAIDGPATTYTAALQNPAGGLQGVLLQGWITQGPTARRAAGGVLVVCNSNPGVFPPGACTMTFSASASNAGGGGAALVPGPATFELDLVQNSGGVATTLDVKTVAITLVSSIPKITSLVLVSPAIVINGASDNYTAQIQNPGFQVSDVILQGELVQVQGSSTVTVGAGGTYISCGAAPGVLPTTGTGTCSIQFTATASNTTGLGTLVPGPAQFVLHLYNAPVNGTQTEYDVRIINVTLTTPPPTITNITPASSFVVLDLTNANTAYSATIQNPGLARSTVFLQGWIRQGAARRAAGASNVTCGPINGTLPNGSCIEAGVIVANNTSSAGSGTLVPGPATFELEIRLNDGTTETVLDTKTIPITLVANTPSIVSISLATSFLEIGGPRASFSAVVYNPTSASLSGVFVQEWIDQVGASRAAGFTDLTCAGTNGTMPVGSCVVSFTMGASNTSSGSGTLVAGGATFRLELKQGTTVLNTRTAGLTLTNPVVALP